MTKEEIISKIQENDTEFFWDLYCDPKDVKIEIVYDQSYGDGNEYNIAMEFTDLNIFIQLEGTYSSWDAPYWSQVVLAMPYEFKETRYKKASTEYLRDKSLNELLGE